MDNQENKKETTPYIRLSEIPKSHKGFVNDAQPVEAKGENEPCYSRSAYEKWQERWENEGGQNVEED